MKILIDADGCPVVDIAVDIAVKNNIECIIICDTSHFFEKKGAKTITVSKGADSTDFFLVNIISSEDIAVTQDYGLAAMCLAKKATVLNQDGMIYDNSNIDSLLMSRHISKKIRNAGGKLKGPSKRKPEQNLFFARKLEEILKDKGCN
ncbi:MAG: YaiI/YqxD family protein [Ruminococcaceae bacterium]|nr:YaiI/YqxD family protein [Oscillospiraceae bacterium]